MASGTGQLLRTLNEGRTITSIAISPNGNILATGSGDNTIRLWNFCTGELLGPLVGHLRDVNSVAIGADSRTIASGSSDHTIRVWNLADRSVSTLVGHLNAVRTVAFAPVHSPHPQIIASGSDDTTIKIWDAARGSLLQTLFGHTKTVNSIAFSSDGKTLVSGSRDCTVKIWRRA